MVVIGVFSLLDLGTGSTIRALIMTFYFCIIGVIIIAVELGSGSFPQWFLFLNFGWGKVYLYMFLVCAILSNPNKGWLHWVVAVSFCVSSGFNLYVGTKYKSQEMDRVRECVEKI